MQSIEHTLAPSTTSRNRNISAARAWEKPSDYQAQANKPFDHEARTICVSVSSHGGSYESHRCFVAPFTFRFANLNGARVREPAHRFGRCPLSTVPNQLWSASQITVHGVTTMSETPPAVAQKVAKTLELDLKVGAGQDAFLDVSVPGFTAVSYIELDSAGYADGSSWHPSDGKTCTILPHSLLGTGR